MLKKIFFSLLFFSSLQLSAQVLSLREQARVVDELMGDRLNNLLPVLMEKNKVDMWVLISREYNEDPVLKTMLPAEWLSARRRTILVFYNNPAKKQLDKLAIARYNVGEHIKAAWDMKQFPDQWEALIDLIRSRNPQQIAVNMSKNYGHADGLDHTEYTEFMEKLPTAFKSESEVSAETQAVNWLSKNPHRT